MADNQGPVRIEKDGSIAFIIVDNPPVNALSQSVRAGLLEAAEEVASDETVEAAIIICAGNTFIAGADIKEFGKPSAGPQLPDVIDRIEGMEKSVIAAIHGTALGGGFEIALGCHHRIAAPGAKVGTPEVNLGIIPGAGGCYRLPRLIGVEPALELITGGAPITADKAVELGAVDEIAEGDLRKAAKSFATKLPRRAVRRTTADDSKIAGTPLTVFETMRRQTEKTKRGQDAPVRAIDAVEAGVTLPIDEAAATCRKIFLELRDSRQAKALRHVFFAEREVTKIPGLDDATKAPPIETGAVIGAGAMGAGIAMCFANAGIPVTLLDISQENVDLGLDTIRKNYAAAVAKGKMTGTAVEKCLGLIKGETDYAKLANVDIIVEAVFEDLELKKKVFATLDASCKADAILATNTSYLDVNAIADATRRPDKVLGLHFFNPAHIMKLLEIVRTDRTSNETLATSLALAKRLRKTGVVSGVCFGFIGNRMLNAYRTEALRMALEGARVAEIDRALYDFGMPMGPFALMDLTGLEVNVKMRAQAAPETIDQPAFKIVDRLYEMGRHGQRSGAGFYKYEEGSRTPLEDAEVDSWITEEARRQGIERKKNFSADQIAGRCMLTLANEGARILEEGVAIRSGDIDVAYIAGYGFPRHLGGPMCWAEQKGLDNIVTRLHQYHEVYGLPRWKPAALIARAASKRISLDEALPEID